MLHEDPSRVLLESPRSNNSLSFLRMEITIWVSTIVTILCRLFISSVCKLSGASIVLLDGDNIKVTCFVGGLSMLYGILFAVRACFSLLG